MGACFALPMNGAQRCTGDPRYLWIGLMTDDYKIYVDASQPATLNNGAGALTDCPTLQEAVIAWRKLAPDQKIRATIKVIGGRVYTAHEIKRLHYGPKPNA